MYQNHRKLLIVSNLEKHLTNRDNYSLMLILEAFHEYTPKTPFTFTIAINEWK